MTAADTEAVTVKLLDKEYLISCPKGEEASLMEAASYLDNKMNEIRNNSRSLSLDRVAVMAALHISHELLQTQRDMKTQQDAAREQLERILAKLENALAEA